MTAHESSPPRKLNFIALTSLADGELIQLRIARRFLAALPHEGGSRKD